MKQTVLLFIGIVAFDAAAYQITTISGVPWYWIQVSNGAMVGTGTTTQPAVNIRSGSLEIPSKVSGKNVVGLTDYAFYNRTGLETITIPSTVEDIGYNAFAKCTGLSKVYTDDIKWWCKIRFADKFSNPLSYAGHLHKNDFFEKEITDLIVPNGITRINNYAFNHCLGLKSLTVSEGVTQIGQESFYYCKGLVSVTLPSSLASVGESAFMGCCAIKSLVLKDGIRDIKSCAFSGCTKLSSLVIPPSVTNISFGAFADCSSITNIFFMGDEPLFVGSNAFDGIASECQVEVLRSAKGWAADENGLWRGMKLAYHGEDNTTFPDIGDNPTKEEFAAVFSDSVDTKLSTSITNASSYSAFRKWTESVKGTNGAETAGVRAVKDSSHAWMSFALGSDKLLEKSPTDEDLTLEEFEPASEVGKFDFTVSVKDVDVGSSAAAENLKQVFGLEGGTSLESGGMSSANVDITFGTPADGKVKFTAGPNAKNADAKTFFMKVKINP